jgi:hypothetical protein
MLVATIEMPGSNFGLSIEPNMELVDSAESHQVNPDTGGGTPSLALSTKVGAPVLEPRLARVAPRSALERPRLSPDPVEIPAGSTWHCLTPCPLPSPVR